MDILMKKKKILDVLTRVFDEFVEENYNLACKSGCSTCCTQDITATTLEAWEMLNQLKKDGKTDLLEQIAQFDQKDLFRPKITTNVMAMYCLNRKEPPVEEPGGDSGACPFLEEQNCAFYSARPLACRGMFAQHMCQPGEEADIPADLATITMICWQIIEHLDVGGLYGNLIDLMNLLGDDNQLFKYQSGEQLVAKGIPPTRPVPGLLVPPDQQEVVGGFLEKLFEADCDGKTFRECMKEVRDSPF
jgi:Fe-S-cluster containining protein